MTHEAALSQADGGISDQQARLYRRAVDAVVSCMMETFPRELSEC
jgi:hypothetical protein